MVLAAIGIYALTYHSVTQRTHEIGVRMAMGARAHEVVAFVMREGIMIAILGIVLGCVGSFSLTRAMARLLYGVTSTDPATFAAVAGMLLAVAAAATVIPARRAARVDPVLALRHE